MSAQGPFRLLFTFYRNKFESCGREHLYAAGYVVLLILVNPGRFSNGNGGLACRRNEDNLYVPKEQYCQSNVAFCDV